MECLNDQRTSSATLSQHSSSRTELQEAFYDGGFHPQVRRPVSSDMEGLDKDLRTLGQECRTPLHRGLPRCRCIEITLVSEAYYKTSVHPGVEHLGKPGN